MRSAVVTATALSVGAAFVFCHCASAGNFSVNPVRLAVSAKARATSLTLQNNGEQPVLVQSEVMAWGQREGADALAPSRDLLVSPPIFKLAPGAAQTVRIGLLRNPDPQRELTYRLFLQEIPPSPAPGRQGVSTALRLSIPVFVAPAASSTRAWRWRVVAPNGDALTLSLANSGNTHVQVIEVRLFLPDGALLAEKQLASYVLAGQARSWTMEARRPWRGERLRLMAKTDGGDVNVEVEGTAR